MKNFGSKGTQLTQNLAYALEWGDCSYLRAAGRGKRDAGHLAAPSAFWLSLWDHLLGRLGKTGAGGFLRMTSDERMGAEWKSVQSLGMAT